jgi:hypothetical protein
MSSLFLNVRYSSLIIKAQAYSHEIDCEETKMIKMQILMDEKKIQREGKYTLSKIYLTLDDFFVNKLHFIKEDNGFYSGTGSSNDFANFGIAMTTLGKKRWFMDNIDTWLYFNSEDSEDPNDYVIEDFKETCREYYSLGA